ncbi:MAG: hypothetical protein U9N11_07415 [Campylobacterota bacterium]|nr:hypothetical protein [Campylobacterota bacterium]
MKKKYFIFTTLFTALLVFSLLPLSNYMADETRVLHHDYENKYAKFHPNRIFLRVQYLLDNKHKYDTLVFGSSRGEFIDTDKISPKAYNMFHGFGTLSTYLQSLKVALNQGVKVKNVWLGINDFEIWKDHSDALHQLTFKDGLFGNTALYMRWLFRNSPHTIDILKDDLPLVQSDFITNPTTQRIIRSRIQEKNLPKRKAMYAAMLGHTEQYKIDASIEDMKKIKRLCRKHNITLKVFFYPSYYLTYLRYDQTKINLFKKKLSAVTEFHDFYLLNKIAYDQTKWFDSSHFATSIGDYMIESIQKNSHLVTHKNVDTHIEKSKSLLLKSTTYPHWHIYIVHSTLDFSTFPTLFDIYDENTKYKKNNHFTMQKEKDGFHINVHGNDPWILVKNIQTETKNSVLEVSIVTDKKGAFRLYLKNNRKENYSEGRTHVVRLKKGLNTFNLIVPSKYLDNDLRIDFISQTGQYIIKKLHIRELN